MDQRTVRVDLAQRAYDIHIASGARAAAGALIAPHLGPGPALVIADDTVAGHYASDLIAQLSSAGVQAHLATFPAGEANKTVATVERLWAACGEHRIDRAGSIIALGGGVTGDLAGFVAGTWMRGVRFVQVPTTLLAMVDSAVGGKTGCNTAAGKNLVGAFVQPAFVLIDPTTLASMAPREFRAGLAEVLKYGIINDPTFLAWQREHAAALAAGEPDAIGHAVAESCRIKAEYVVADEREQGQRAHLNYGHTFGHALERETGYGTWHHGEAVGIGMRMAAVCADRLGMLEDPDLIPIQDDLLRAWQLPTHHATAGASAAWIERLCDACRLDKKARAGAVRFVLPQRPGVVSIVSDPDPTAVAAGFAAGLTDAADAG